jgi:hypothetical protein
MQVGCWGMQLCSASKQMRGQAKLARVSATTACSHDLLVGWVLLVVEGLPGKQACAATDLLHSPARLVDRHTGLPMAPEATHRQSQLCAVHHPLCRQLLPRAPRSAITIHAPCLVGVGSERLLTEHVLACSRRQPCHERGVCQDTPLQEASQPACRSTSLAATADAWWMRGG